MREIEERFGLAGESVLRYEDARRGNARHVLVREGKLAAVSLAGDISAERWLKDYLESGQAVASLGRLLLMPSSKAPQGFKPRGCIVCNCFNVSQTEIEDALDRPDAESQEALTSLQHEFKWETNCGSCVPELKKIILARAVKIP